MFYSNLLFEFYFWNKKNDTNLKLFSFVLVILCSFIWDRYLLQRLWQSFLRCCQSSWQSHLVMVENRKQLAARRVNIVQLIIVKNVVPGHQFIVYDPTWKKKQLLLIKSKVKAECLDQFGYLISSKRVFFWETSNSFPDSPHRRICTSCGRGHCLQSGTSWRILGCSQSLYFRL